jgi:hypothetical protein
MNIDEIRSRIRRTVNRMAPLNTQLGVAKRRWHRFAKRAKQAHDNAVEYERKADRFRREGKRERARYWDKKANRAHARAFNRHQRALWRIDQIKGLTQRKEKLETRKDKLEKAATDWEKEHGVTIEGNKVSGGTPAQRLKACMLRSAANCAAGKRRNFYSQAGSWDVDHCLTGEQYGDRSDCSSWFTSVYKSCGLDDPNGTRYSGGYTGTLGNHGKSITRSEATKTAGAAILFGYAPYHHVEMAIGDGTTGTIGHGSAAVDRGTFDLLGGPKAYRKYPQGD